MSGIETKQPKSRVISLYQYYEVLQLEWISSDLRVRLYRDIKNKKYWSRVCDGKKIKIETIAQLNHLPSIFDDKDLLEALRSRVFREDTYPNFIYKDEEQRMNIEYWDLFYYYYIGSEVRVELFGETKVGKIKSYRPLLHSITVEIDKKPYTFNIDKVVRIL